MSAEKKTPQPLPQEDPEEEEYKPKKRLRPVDDEIDTQPTKKQRQEDIEFVLEDEDDDIAEIDFTPDRFETFKKKIEKKKKASTAYSSSSTSTGRKSNNDKVLEKKMKEHMNHVD